MLPYTAVASEDITWVCRKYSMQLIFRSGRSLHSVLSKVKGTLPVAKQFTVIYRIPCSYDKAYFDDTKRVRETRLKEHQDAC